ncbi:MAG: DinB family protein [Saprospiraceae bacterium]
MNSTTIKLNIQASHDKLINTVASLTPEECMEPPEDKWTGLQHIRHIELSISPVVKLLGNREKYFSRNFGESVEGSKPYDIIEAVYIKLLEPGMMAPQPFMPPVLSYEEKDTIFNEFNVKVKALQENMDNWSEEELDKYFIPHPLLGNLTFREMLYFSIYHASHHRRNVERTLMGPRLAG